MRRFLSSFAFVFFLSVSGFAQKVFSSDTTSLRAAEALKTSLVNKLKFLDGEAAKIVVIENDFHAQLKAIDALGSIPTKDKEVKLNQAHVARRTALMAIPLTGRQMEDVVELSDQTWRVHKR